MNSVKRFSNGVTRLLRSVSYPRMPKSDLPKDMLAGLLLTHVVREKQFSTVLDIGSGAGKHARYFEEHDKIVTRFDFGKSRAFTDTERTVIGDFVNHDFSDQYDLIWASHVLEHTIHTHDFLVKMLKTAKPEGYVAITVPPAKSQFVGGHVTLWTPALLLYRMVLAGFDCSQAEVLVYRYNISVLCPAVSNDLDLNTLAWDINDIERIQKWLPADLKVRADGACYGKVYRGANIRLQ